MFKILITIVVGVGLAGCTSPNAGTKPVQIGSTPGISTTGSIRVVTERVRTGRIVCTEPSPDYAVAFNANRTITINAPAAATDMPSGGATSNKTETIVEPNNGRSAAVLALRDGLYAACQSYANGVIGHDAYAMILSQYGALLVALVSNDATKAGLAASTIGTRSATLSALTVACVSSYDGTRLPATTNALLTPKFCNSVFDKALQLAGGAVVALK